MSNIFKEWDNKFNNEELIENVNALPDGDEAREEVPHGKYEVKIEKMELTKSKEFKRPMVSIWFQVIQGKHQKQFIFYNQVLVTNANEFNRFGFKKLKTLLQQIDPDIEFKWDGSFSHLSDKILDIKEMIDKNKWEFALDYKENAKGFNEFEILEVYE